MTGNVLWKTSLEELLLGGGELSDRVDLGDTLGLSSHRGIPSSAIALSFQEQWGTHAQLDVRGEVLDTLVLVQGGLDEGGLDDTLLAVQGADDRVDEDSTG